MSFAPEDLTPRARIRDTAMRLFAEHGFAGASIRDVADAAGVSPGLVQHHYRSKEALRQACDEYAVAVFRETKQGSLREEQLSNPAFIAAAYQHTLPAIRYLARALAEGTPGSQLLFDELVELFKAEIGPHVDSGDPDAFTAVLVAQALGLMVLHQHVSRVLGVDILTPEGHPRVARAMLEIYSQRMISPEFAAAGFDSLRRFEAGDRASSAAPGAHAGGADAGEQDADE